MKFPYVELRPVPSGYIPTIQGLNDDLSYMIVNLLRYERIIGNLDSIPATKEEARKLGARILRDLALDLESEI